MFVENNHVTITLPTKTYLWDWLDADYHWVFECWQNKTTNLKTSPWVLQKLWQKVSITQLTLHSTVLRVTIVFYNIFLNYLYKLNCYPLVYKTSAFIYFMCAHNCPNSMYIRSDVPQLIRCEKSRRLHNGACFDAFHSPVCPLLTGCNIKSLLKGTWRRLLLLTNCFKMACHHLSVLLWVKRHPELITCPEAHQSCIVGACVSGSMFSRSSPRLV